jgi:hypothetical protein
MGLDRVGQQSVFSMFPDRLGHKLCCRKSTGPSGISSLLLLYLKKHSRRRNCGADLVRGLAQRISPPERGKLVVYLRKVYLHKQNLRISGRFADKFVNV